MVLIKKILFGIVGVCVLAGCDLQQKNMPMYDTINVD